MSVTVTVQCIVCGTCKELGTGTAPLRSGTEVPMCDKCFNVMVPVRAKSKPLTGGGAEE